MKVNFVYNKNTIMECNIAEIPRIGDKVTLDGRVYKVIDILWMIYKTYDYNNVVKIVIV